MRAELLIDGRDVSGLTIYDASVQCGRDNVEGQPDASVLEATVEGWADAGQVGSTIVLGDIFGRLMAGAITDLATTLYVVPDNEGVPVQRWRTKITATGPLAMLGHQFVGQAGYPAQTDVQRVTQILAEAGHTVHTDPDAVALNLNAREAELSDAASVARAAATDGMGVLWENPAAEVNPLAYTPHALRNWGAIPLTWAGTGDVSWADLDPTMAWSRWTSDYLPSVMPQPALHLRARQILADGLTFSQTIGDWARKHTVAYGVEPLDPETGESVGDRPTLVVGEGYPEREHDTQLATVADAEIYADVMLKRHGSPAYRLQAVSLALHNMHPETRQTIRAALAVGCRITIDFPHGSPVGTVWQGFLEGWSHYIASDERGSTHMLDLTVSDRSLTEAADRWRDITGDLAWSEVNPTMTWDNATHW